MKNWWRKVKEFFSRPKVLKWTIVILTSVIVIGAIKALIWTIYTQDKPTFVPDEMREDIQGVIKESGESIKKVSKPVGSAIVDSAYKKPEVHTVPALDPTAGWKTYTNSKIGINIKYPQNLLTEYTEEPFEQYIGTLTFINNQTAVFDLDIFVSGEDSLAWVNKLAAETNFLTEINEVALGNKKFIKAIEAGDPDHFIYVTNLKGKIFKYKVAEENYRELENVLIENN